MKKPNSTFPILCLALLTGLLYTFFSSHRANDPRTIQKGISEKIIRFHVIANSDSEEDQQLKLKVKEAVVNYTTPLLADSHSLCESEAILQQESQTIKTIADSVIAENGYSYPVTVSLTDTYFPTKSYGNYTFPPGIYRAFEIRIGKAAGKNWWCVMYPPLCFIDLSHGVVDERGEHQMKEILTTDEFNAISRDQQVVYRFKYLKFLNHLF